MAAVRIRVYNTGYHMMHDRRRVSHHGRLDNSMKSRIAKVSALFNPTPRTLDKS